MDMQTLSLIVPLAPLAGAVVVGLFGRSIGRVGAHLLAIAGVLAAFVASVLIYQDLPDGGINQTIYTWMRAGGLDFSVGFQIDQLTVLMMLVVSFVSLMVHIYTIGYMAGDPGYQRFFSYISLFTFSMLMLVMANNFLQLFFGWEAVGLVSYLLIGFWFQRPTAIYANLKAFIANRVGDFGFLLGIGLIAAYAGSLDYQTVFGKAQELTALQVPGTGWPLLTAICICLFIGAMAKSAQVPLHVWLPDSMEGPTPISALIHAATMVTAGIFMVARMSPLFELSPAALSFVLVIGATTALFMGFLGIVQNDIKRVVAYSTLSQLGYMTVALGVSAYSAAIFHLMTHAFFKALLFLAAGSVIIGLHHDQDMRRMGGLWKYMPVTWITSLVGSLALIGTPFFSGFYSKDSIIEAVHAASIPGSGYALFCVLAGVFVTALYSFRMYFLVFHGKERFGQAQEHPDSGEHHGLAPGHKPHESPLVVTLPLILLAIPSAAIGWLTIEPLLFGGWLDEAIKTSVELEKTAPLEMALHGLLGAPFWLAVFGVVAAWMLYLCKPAWPALVRGKFEGIYRLLDNKYYFDRFNEIVFAGGARLMGAGLWRGGDQGVIDGVGVTGSSRLVALASRALGLFQTGHLYQYAFTMIAGLVLLLTFWVLL
ncbi:MAG: NADH-quinone oxidoreductase subunit L [Azoarcus sp.]|jgi:NADH-quinone oxidoreductase subunit L|nr:NADH-quinone oxidoreductase subunit L [Azoarcus sp.]